MGHVLGLIKNIAVITSVIVLMIIGIKYIIATVDQKAKYKETIFPYVVGIILISSGTFLVDFVYKLLFIKVIR